LGMRLAALISLACVLTVTAAASTPPRIPFPVRTDPALLEQSPAASGNYLAWAQSSTSRRHFDVLAQVNGGRPFKVNARGTQGRPGSISGRILAYQEWRGGRSDIRLFDFVGRKRTNPARGVNTPSWESRPSLSGRWLFFNRRNGRTKVELVLLRNLRTGRQIVLDRARPPERVLVQQLAGRYAVWTYCRYRCFVVGYDRTSGKRIRPPSSGIPESSDYAASVLADGTIYFVRGSMFCDAGSLGAVLIRYRKGTGSERFLDFDRVMPLALDASVHDGTPVVYFDRGPCKGEDIYRVFDAPPAARP
jgi:hypothetical protein